MVAEFARIRAFVAGQPKDASLEHGASPRRQAGMPAPLPRSGDFGYIGRVQSPSGHFVRFIAFFM